MKKMAIRGILAAVMLMLAGGCNLAKNDIIADEACPAGKKKTPEHFSRDARKNAHKAASEGAKKLR